MSIPRPLVKLLVVLLAYALTGHVDCRESEACQVTAVTHNEGFAMK
jgi:hypothetical protein